MAQLSSSAITAVGEQEDASTIDKPMQEMTHLPSPPREIEDGKVDKISRVDEMLPNHAMDGLKKVTFGTVEIKQVSQDSTSEAEPTEAEPTEAVPTTEVVASTNNGILYSNTINDDEMGSTTMSSPVENQGSPEITKPSKSEGEDDTAKDGVISHASGLNEDDMELDRDENTQNLLDDDSDLSELTDPTDSDGDQKTLLKVTKKPRRMKDWGAPLVATRSTRSVIAAQEEAAAIELKEQEERRKAERASRRRSTTKAIPIPKAPPPVVSQLTKVLRSRTTTEESSVISSKSHQALTSPLLSRLRARTPRSSESTIASTSTGRPQRRRSDLVEREQLSIGKTRTSDRVTHQSVRQPAKRPEPQSSQRRERPARKSYTSSSASTPTRARSTVPNGTPSSRKRKMKTASLTSEDDADDMSDSSLSSNYSSIDIGLEEYEEMDEKNHFAEDQGTFSGTTNLSNPESFSKPVMTPSVDVTNHLDSVEQTRSSLRDEQDYQPDHIAEWHNLNGEKEPSPHVQAPPTPAATSPSFTALPSFISDEPMSDNPDSSSDEDSDGELKEARATQYDSHGLSRPVPSYYYDAEYDPANIDGSKKKGRRGGFKGIPVFEPTMEDFEGSGGFYGFVKRIEKYGMRSGIVKVIPPKEWSNELPSTAGPLQSIRLKEPIEQHFMGSQGLYRVTNVAKTRIWNAAQWKELSETPKLAAPDWLGDKRDKGERSERSTKGLTLRRRKKVIVEGEDAEEVAEHGDVDGSEQTALVQSAEIACENRDNPAPVETVNIVQEGEQVEMTSDVPMQEITMLSRQDNGEENAFKGFATQSAEVHINDAGHCATFETINATQAHEVKEDIVDIVMQENTVPLCKKCEAEEAQKENAIQETELVEKMSESPAAVLAVTDIAETLHEDPELLPEDPGKTLAYCFSTEGTVAGIDHANVTTSMHSILRKDGPPSPAPTEGTLTTAECAADPSSDQTHPAVPKETIPVKKKRIQKKRPTNNKRAEPTEAEWQAFVATLEDLPNNMKKEDYTIEMLREVERRYWRTLTFGEPPMYGADMNGSIFDDSTTAWNVANLGDLLPKLVPDSCKIPGVVSPYLYFGMWRATFAWHVEDADLYSINYIHFGAPKFWYSVPQEQSDRFERVMAGFFPTDRARCSQFLRHKSFLASPRALANYGITLNRVVQMPGEFILTYPKGYHSGFNLGFNCAESINFATERWLPLGKVTKACDCIEDSVNIDVNVWLAEAARAEAIANGEYIPPEIEKTPRRKRAWLENSETETTDPEGSNRAKSTKLDKDSMTPTSVLKELKRRDKLQAERDAKLPIFVCALCPDMSTEGLVRIGEPGVETKKSLSAHRICVLFTPTTWIEEDAESGQEIVRGFGHIEKARWKLKCQICAKKHGTKIQCTTGRCPKAFHVTCALQEESGVHLDVTIKQDGIPISIMGQAMAEAQPEKSGDPIAPKIAIPQRVTLSEAQALSALTFPSATSSERDQTTVVTQDHQEPQPSITDSSYLDATSDLTDTAETLISIASSMHPICSMKPKSRSPSIERDAPLFQNMLDSAAVTESAADGSPTTAVAQLSEEGTQNTPTLASSTDPSLCMPAIEKNAEDALPSSCLGVETASTAPLETSGVSTDSVIRLDTGSSKLSGSNEEDVVMSDSSRPATMSMAVPVLLTNDEPACDLEPTREESDQHHALSTSAPIPSQAAEDVGEYFKLTILCRTHNPAWKIIEKARKVAELKAKVDTIQPSSFICVKTSGGVFEVIYVSNVVHNEAVAVIFGDGKRANVKWRNIVWEDSPEVRRRKEETEKARAEGMFIYDHRPIKPTQRSAILPATSLPASSNISEDPIASTSNDSETIPATDVSRSQLSRADGAFVVEKRLSMDKFDSVSKDSQKANPIFGTPGGCIYPFAFNNHATSLGGNARGQGFGEPSAHPINPPAMSSPSPSTSPESCGISRPVGDPTSYHSRAHSSDATGFPSYLLIGGTSPRGKYIQAAPFTLTKDDQPELSAPIVTCTSTSPVALTEPVAPTTPIAPTAPIAPIAPDAPLALISPSDPVAQVALIDVVASVVSDQEPPRPSITSHEADGNHNEAERQGLVEPGPLNESSSFFSNSQ